MRVLYFYDVIFVIVIFYKNISGLLLRDGLKKSNFSKPSRILQNKQPNNCRNDQDHGEKRLHFINFYKLPLQDLTLTLQLHQPFRHQLILHIIQLQTITQFPDGAQHLLFEIFSTAELVRCLRCINCIIYMLGSSFEGIVTPLF